MFAKLVGCSTAQKHFGVIGSDRVNLPSEAGSQEIILIIVCGAGFSFMYIVNMIFGYPSFLINSDSPGNLNCIN